jgi:hypothetical protein
MCTILSTRIRKYTGRLISVYVHVFTRDKSIGNGLGKITMYLWGVRPLSHSIYQNKFQLGYKIKLKNTF